MQDKQKKQVLDAFLVVLRPVIRILLRYGIGYREFVEVIKTAYVDVASSDFGLRGRPTNISRVAVMTGLTRKEVRRLRDKIALGSDRINVKTTPITDVIHHWYSDNEFSDANGNPRTLPFSGDKGSFTSLVKRFGGDIPAGAMRTEMKRVGVVRENSDKTLTIEHRSFQPTETHDVLMSSLVHGVYPLLANTAHNTNPERDGETWANRVTHTQIVKPADSGRLRRISRDRIVDFSESVDDIFMAYESMHENGGTDRGDCKPIAVGVYYFEEQDDGAKYDW